MNRANFLPLVIPRVGFGPEDRSFLVSDKEELPHAMSIVRCSLNTNGQLQAASRIPKPVIHENRGTLSLRFGCEGEIQSEMHLANPDRLVLGYTRAMMGFLLFVECPEHIGLIGL